MSSGYVGVHTDGETDGETDREREKKKRHLPQGFRDLGFVAKVNCEGLKRGLVRWWFSGEMQGQGSHVVPLAVGMYLKYLKYLDSILRVLLYEVPKFPLNTS